MEFWLVLVFVLGVEIGAIVTSVLAYWALATGRRTVRPWTGWMPVLTVKKLFPAARPTREDTPQ